MILLMMNGKIDESCPILPHNYTPCISMYSSYTLVKALGCTQIFIFEKQISSWELLTPDPLQVRLEALRQEHPGKSEEPKIGVFFFLLGWGDVPWDVFQFLGKLLLGWFLIWDLLEELFWVWSKLKGGLESARWHWFPNLDETVSVVFSVIVHDSCPLFVYFFVFVWHLEMTDPEVQPVQKKIFQNGSLCVVWSHNMHDSYNLMFFVCHHRFERSAVHFAFWY